MTNRIVLLIGIIGVVIGVLWTVAFLLNGYVCMCPAQLTGGPSTCSCQPNAAYYDSILVGLGIIISGIAIIIYSLKEKKISTPMISLNQ